MSAPADSVAPSPTMQMFLRSGRSRACLARMGGCLKRFRNWVPLVFWGLELTRIVCEFLAYIQPRALLEDGKDRLSGPMVDLRRIPDDDLVFPNLRRIGRADQVRFVLDFEGVECAGRGGDGFSADHLRRAHPSISRTSIEVLGIKLGLPSLAQGQRQANALTVV